MPPEKTPHKHHEQSPQNGAARRALNTPQNVKTAIETCRDMLALLRPGSVWRHQGPHGKEIKGALLLGDSIVIVLHFSPEDGSVLPKGLHGFSEGTAEVVALVEARLREMPKSITVLDGAEFREPECCWAIPIAHQGRIVAHVKVSPDGTEILPDQKAMNEPKP